MVREALYVAYLSRPCLSRKRRDSSITGLKSYTYATKLLVHLPQSLAPQPLPPKDTGSSAPVSNIDSQDSVKSLITTSLRLEKRLKHHLHLCRVQTA